MVGKHCESGDVLVRDGAVPADLAVGDVLATPVTGAYGHSMGSNYNKVPAPAVVFVRDGDARLVVRRETDDDLLRHRPAAGTTGFGRRRCRAPTGAATGSVAAVTTDDGAGRRAGLRQRRRGPRRS